MQLSPNPERRGALRGRLAAATCLLVGAASEPADATEVTSATLLYSEPDRVTAIESRASLVTEIAEDRVLTVRLALDSLTGASPNGAPAASVPQTFTKPSGAGSYTTAAGETPLDDTFHDTRLEGSASLDWPLGRRSRGVVGGSISSEHDYRSFGLNGRVSRDFFQRNTTLAIGVAGAFDTIAPEGGPPIPLASMSGAGTAQPRTAGDETKNVVDALVGVTQVVDRETIVQLNWSVSRSSGYLTDPYKLVSVLLDEGSAAPGLPVDYVYESRPDERTKQALYGEVKRALGRDVADVSYRFLWDDWGIRSHTIEGRYHWQLAPVHALEPQVRFYRQGAADFFTFGLVDGEARPEFATGDTRLGDFDAWTFAAKYSTRFPSGIRAALRLGYYRQAGDGHPAESFGAQRDQDLFPTVTAILSQVSLTYGW